MSSLRTRDEFLQVFQPGSVQLRPDPKPTWPRRIPSALAAADTFGIDVSSGSPTSSCPNSSRRPRDVPVGGNSLG